MNTATPENIRPDLHYRFTNSDRFRQRFQHSSCSEAFAILPQSCRASAHFFPEIEQLPIKQWPNQRSTGEILLIAQVFAIITQVPRGLARPLLFSSVCTERPSSADRHQSNSDNETATDPVPFKDGDCWTPISRNAILEIVVLTANDSMNSHCDPQPTSD